MNDPIPVLSSIIEKLGTVLAHTKDALLKDFLGDLPSYLPADYSFEKFVEDTKKPGESPFEKFIESLFTRLGYDISSAPQSKKMVDLVRSIIGATISLSEGIKTLVKNAGSTDWLGTAQGFLEESKLLDSDLDFKNFYKDTELAKIKDSAVKGSDNIIMVVFNLILELIDLIRAFRDLKLSEMESEAEGFGTFIKDTYFNQKFAERIFDHIFTVVLKNAKEVFADDIDILIEKVKDIQNLPDELKNRINKELDPLKKEIDKIENQIKEIKKEITGEVGNALNMGKEYVDNVASELQVQLKMKKAELEKLAKEVFKNYNAVGETLSQIYAVLEFFQVFKVETIEIAKFTNNWSPPQIPSPNDLNDLIKKANGVVDNISDIDKVKKEAIDQLKKLCPTVSINTIHWENLEKLFTKPADFLKTLFPINNYKDAEEALAKIMKLARAFNANIPDFNSLKQLLFEFLVRLQNKIMNELKNNEQIRTAFEKFRDFIVDLLKTLEAIAIQTKTVLNQAIKDFEDKKDSIINSLQNEVNSTITKIKSTVEDKINYNADLKNLNLDEIPQFIDVNATNYAEQFKQIFVDSYINSLIAKAKQFDLFKNIPDEEWKTIFNDKKYYDEITKNLKSSIKEIESIAGEIFNDKTFEKRFKAIISDLKKEFENQTKNITKTIDDLKNIKPEYIQNLVAGNFSSPFSTFDFTAFFSIFTNGIKQLVPYNPETYYLKFREEAVKAAETLVSASGTAFEAAKKKVSTDEFKHKLKDLAIDAFTPYWDELKKSIETVVIRPYLSLIEQAVKNWVKEKLLHEILKKIGNTADEFIKTIFETKDHFENTYKFIKDNSEIAKDLIKLITDATEIKSWQGGLQFAISLYKIIPDDVKNYLRDIVELPEAIKNIDLSKHYSLDIKNKFLAIKLFESGEIKNQAFNADISIKLVAFVGKYKFSEEEEKFGVYLMPAFKGNFKLPGFSAGQNHELVLGASASVNEEFAEGVANKEKEELEKITGFFFTTKDKKFNVKFLGDTESVKAYLDFIFQRKSTAPPLTIIDSEIVGLTLKNYPQKLFLGFTGGDFDCGYLGKLEELVFKLRLHKINDFFAMILNNDIVITVPNFSLGYSLSKGFKVAGDVKFRLPFQTNIDLQIVKFSSIILELGASFDKANTLMASLLTSFTVDFKGIGITFSELGFGVEMNYMTPDKKFGDFDLTPKFHFPTGVGISINLEAVKGTGIIKWDKEKEEFLGAVELNILDMVGASAMILFNMKMPDGSKGFSFMGALSVSFNPGIQLGMGFTLNMLGGSLGINRAIDTCKLTNAVRDGSLGSILFQQDLKKNLDKVLANASVYYPIKKDQFFFGFFAQIRYTDVIKADVGLFIQAPNPVTITIAGGVHVSISDSAESLLSINAYFSATLDFSRGFSLDVSLVDSKIVGINLSGDIALRIFWAGDTKGFIFSAGGFHPLYKPEEGFLLGNMNRLALKLDYSILKMSLEAYFAITSNTVQFGAHFQISIGWKEAGLHGSLTFDAIFQFNPFWFSVGMSAKLSVNVFGLTLLAIGLSFTLSGPAQWNAKGSASFKVLFIPFKVDFNETWGKKQSTSDKKYIEVYQLYQASFEDNCNWKAIPGDLVDGSVGVVQFNATELVMQPSDTLAFSQNAVPLAQDMVRYGEGYPGDMMKLELKSVNIEGTEIKTKDLERTNASFAPTLIRELDKDKKLKAKSYEDMEAGFKLRVGAIPDKGKEQEIKCGDIETTCQADMEKWEQYFANLNKMKTMGAKIVSPDKEITSPTIVPISSSAKQKVVATENVKRVSTSARLQTVLSECISKFGKLNSPDRNVNQLHISKAAFRRTNVGFNRYIKALDLSMNNKLDNLIELLDKK